MDASYLAKALESVVLKVLEENPIALTNALNNVLDGEQECGIELVNKLQKKMTPSLPAPTSVVSTASSSANMQLNADERVRQLVKDLDACLKNSRQSFIDTLTDMEFTQEDRVDTMIDDKMGDFCDEDTVKELINGAWNGA